MADVVIETSVETLLGAALSTNDPLDFGSGTSNRKIECLFGTAITISEGNEKSVK